MKKFFFLLGLTVVLCVPNAALAGPQCDALAGAKCKVGGCTGGEISNGQLDCATGEKCCRPPAGTICAQSGHCAASCSGGEKPDGQQDCPEGQSCCKLPKAPSTTGGSTGVAPSFSGKIDLPPCTESGNCTVDDIVQTGVNFAGFLMGLSGALFFMIFIYGGALYLMSFGDKGRVDKGKKAIIGAAIGIVIVMGAWTIVQYIVRGIKGVGGGGSAPATGQTGTPNDCSTVFAGYTCKSFPDAKGTADLRIKCEAANDCKPGHCSGQYDMCAKSK